VLSASEQSVAPGKVDHFLFRRFPNPVRDLPINTRLPLRRTEKTQRPGEYVLVGTETAMGQFLGWSPPIRLEFSLLPFHETGVYGMD
jgi:hypothetical protein